MKPLFQNVTIYNSKNYNQFIEKKLESYMKIY